MPSKRSKKTVRKAVTIRKAKKTKGAVRKTAVKRPAKKADQRAARMINDVEELLIRNLVKAGAAGAKNDIIAQDLVLCLTQSTRKMGYNSGFYFGRKVYEEGRANIEMFFDVLEKLGLGKVLYYPAGEHVIITSTIPIKDGRMPLNTGIHVFEAGLISGYLSGYLNRMVWTREVLCSYKNSDVCQFIADTSSEQGVADSEPVPKFDDAVTAIAMRISKADDHGMKRDEDRDYLMLPSLPLIKSSMVEHASKVFYIAGEKLAVISKDESYKETLRRIGSYFDMAGVDVSDSEKSKRVIRLRYKQYNSVEGLVRLSSSMAVGFLARFFGSEPKAKIGIGKDRTYFVSITLQR